MITEQCELYVINKGFTSLWDVCPGDKVYTLNTDDRNVEIMPIESIGSEYFSGKIRRVDSGQCNVDVTDDARFLCYSELYGIRLVSFSQIPNITPNKAYDAKKYLPVLSAREQSEPNVSVQDLEAVARMITVNDIDINFFNRIVSSCSGSDAAILIDMLEFWLSSDPGKGWFGRAQVKARSHEIHGKYMTDELSKVAVLAGYTAAGIYMCYNRYNLYINYESMPIPGSRPKNQKYYNTYYTGHLFNINADNRPIMGRSRSKIFYLPTTTELI